ncbi:MAG: hypothetical protein ACD_12C00807G0004 [uncultured bacterium]|nr:MAG: hypothetical protein ACD_12C00807G0004 [uncultured bacterium]
MSKIPAPATYVLRSKPNAGGKNDCVSTVVSLDSSGNVIYTNIESKVGLSFALATILRLVTLNGFSSPRTPPVTPQQEKVTIRLGSGKVIL